jgi:hypothetical protein
MADTPLTRRLGIKPGARVAVVNAPEGYVELLTPLPDGVTVSQSLDGAFDVVQVFVYDKADVDRRAAGALAALKPKGIVWFTYPKKTGRIKTDIHRDVGWDAVNRAGYVGIAQISVDETWSATRFRPESDVKRRA